MNKHIADIHSLLLPLQDSHLLLPNAAVAEITEYRPAQVLDGMPAWCLGKVTWRGLEIPLISYEAFVGDDVPEESSRFRIAVLNTLNKSADTPFIAVVLKGIPRLLTAGSDTVVAEAAAEAVEGVLARVQAVGEAAMIPDIDALERSVASLNAA